MFKTILFLVALGSSQCTLNPPPPYQTALMARYIIHNTAWVSISTISTQDNIKGYPYVTLKSFSDGPAKNSTGQPYLYMSDLDVSAQDIKADSRMTIMASLVEEDYCRIKNFDPQDPRCAKVMITGRLLRLPKDSAEYSFAKEALFEKHPSMKHWPTGHNFYVAKVNIEIISVLDFFGGIKHVTKEDYFHPKLDDILFDEPDSIIIDMTV